jgi:hypothetical protein
MDLTFVLLFFVVAVLIMVSPMYKSSKSFHKNMFWAEDVTSVGVVSNVEVFAVDDKEFGSLVGLVFNGADCDQRLSITPKDALFLAEMLEEDAKDAESA